MSSSQSAGTNGDQAVGYFRWHDYRRDPRWHVQNSGWGSHRAVYPYVESAQVSGHLVRIPGGQKSPWHGIRGGENRVIFLGVRGLVEFSAAGNVYQLRPFDAFVFGGTPYSYQNPAFDEALFWVLNRRRAPDRESVRATGYQGQYYEGEPEYDSDASDRLHFLSSEVGQRSVSWGEPDSEDQMGFHIGTCPGLEAAGILGHTIRVPGGQSSRAETAGVDRMYVQLLGESEFKIGSDRYSLEALDVVTVPPGVESAYMNPAFSESLLFEVVPTD